MITFKQSNFGQASDAPGPVLSVSASYISDNTAGNVGFAFICNTGGVAPTTVTDSNDNKIRDPSYYLLFLWCKAMVVMTPVSRR